MHRKLGIGNVRLQQTCREYLRGYHAARSRALLVAEVKGSRCHHLNSSAGRGRLGRVGIHSPRRESGSGYDLADREGYPDHLDTRVEVTRHASL